MKTPLQLDDLNLDATTKTQVAALVQSLLGQTKTEAAKYYEADLNAKDLKIQALILELAHLRRIRYGVKNEALSSLQRDLLQDICNEDIAALEAEVEQVEDDQANATITKPKRPRAGRQPLPPHLPRIEHLHEPESCQCGRCGKDLVKIGEDISEQLDVEPAKFFVHRHIRPQYTCRPCETITAAPIPPAIIDGGIDVCIKAVRRIRGNIRSRGIGVDPAKVQLLRTVRNSNTHIIACLGDETQNNNALA